MSAHAAPAETRALPRARPRAVPAGLAARPTLLTVALAAALVAAFFEARRRLQLAGNTRFEIGAAGLAWGTKPRFEIGAGVLAGVAGGAALLVGAGGSRAWGAGSLALFAL